MLSHNPDPQIGGVLVQDRAAALELVFSYLGYDERRSHVEEVLHSSKGTFPFSLRRKLGQSPRTPTQCFAAYGMAGCDGLMGLLGAYRAGRLVGAAFSQLRPDKTSIVWLPRLTHDEPQSTAIALLSATWSLLAEHGTTLAQVLLPAVDDRDAALLRQGGLCHLANLLYLVSAQQHFPTVCPTIPFHLERCSTDNRDRLGRVHAASLDGTLDCPALAGVQAPEDVLLGYRSASPAELRHWFIARHEHRDIGCLLLADHPRQNNMEIQYLGLISSARGRGWGKPLVRYAQWIAGRVGRSRLVLAVDEANAPAVQTYTATDFQTWQRRRLYIRQLHSAVNWHTSSRQVIHAGRPTFANNSALSKVTS